MTARTPGRVGRLRLMALGLCALGGLTAPHGAGAAPTATAPATATATATTAAPAGQRDGFALTAERYKLPSGMTVLLRRDPTLPRVAVTLWFAVGSKDEVRGRTGFAHLYEHLMFMGTKLVPSGGFDELMEAEGGNNNASTSNDYTFYYDTGPSHLLPLLLWLEAERLTNLPQAMTDEKVALQREVVRNERRQSYENRPYGQVELRLPEALYPEGHPYRWPVIGSHQDLIAATTDDVKDFFYTHYVPSNATLCIVGDFDPAEARRQIQTYFGWMPPSPRPAPRGLPAGVSEPKAPVETEVALRERVALPGVFLAWHAPRANDSGFLEARLAAEVLAGGKASRLYRSLVVEKRLAQSVELSVEALSLGSLIQVAIVGQQGATVPAIRAAVEAELKKLGTQPIAEREVERARNQVLTALAQHIETPVGQAQVLQQMHSWFGDAGALAGYVRDLRALKAPAIQARAQSLGLSEAGRRVTITVTPIAGPPPSTETKPGAAAVASPTTPKPASASPVHMLATAGMNWPAALSKPPRLGALRKPAPKQSARFRIDGLDVLLVQRKATMLHEAVLLFPIGEKDVPAAKSGLPSVLASLLTEGAGSRSASEFADALETEGATIQANVREDTTALELAVLGERYPQAAALLADAALRPRLSPEDWERVRGERLALLSRERDEPHSVALRALGAALYGEQHPLGRPSSGRESTIAGISVADLRAFHAAEYRRDRATLVVAGDFPLTRAVAARLAAPFASWPATTPAAPAASPTVAALPPAAGYHGIVLIDRPGAPQSEVMVANLVPGQADPARAPVALGNVLLGGQFTSRLNQNLREQHGWTYGASSRLIRLASTGWFVARSAIRTEVTPEGVVEILREMEKLRSDPISTDELSKGKKALIQHFVAQSEHTRLLAAFYAQIARYGLPLDEESRYLVGAQAATPVVLKKALASELLPAEATIIIVGDSAKLEPGLLRLLAADGPLSGKKIYKIPGFPP